MASACGIIHGFVFTPDGGYAPAYFQAPSIGGSLPSGFDFAIVYALLAALLMAMHLHKPGEIEN